MMMWIFFTVFSSVCVSTASICTSDSFYLRGADSFFGFAGGVSGAPALDGCYTELSELSDNRGYSRFGAYADGPVMSVIEWDSTYGDAWMLYQYEATYNTQLGDYLTPVSELLFYTLYDDYHPVDETNWYEQIGTSPFEVTEYLTFTCGCDIYTSDEDSATGDEDSATGDEDSATNNAGEINSSSSSSYSSASVIAGATVGTIGMVSIIIACVYKFGVRIKCSCDKKNTKKNTTVVDVDIEGCS